MHQLRKPPHRSLHDLAKQYGPIMFLRLGSAPTVVVSSSEMAKEFLKTHDLVFANRPESAAAKYVAYNEKNLCLAPYGDYWRLMRKVCVLELLSAKRVESFRSVREEEVYLGVKSIWEKSKHGKVAVNVRKSIASLISSIIWRTLAGTKISQDDDLVGDELNRMVQQVTSMIGAFNIGDFIPSISWIDELSGVKGKMKKAHNFFDRVVGKIIDEHIEERRRRGNQDQKNHTKDLVDILLEMAQNESDSKITREHIKATVFDMFLGALETTITTLEWAMSEMVRNPHVAQKLQAKIESISGKQRMVRESDLVGMEYLQCVVKEVFRLYPAGPLMLPHESTEDCTVAGYFLPRMTRLIVNVWAIGRDPAVWEDPSTFKPERFIGKNIEIKGRDFEMLPFGAGRRGCPGAGFAMANIELVLAQLVHCFDWTLEGNGNPSELDMTEAFMTSLPRKDNLLAVPTFKLELNM
ncbi:cytochrome P450 750A1-like [Cryptomeria japonica]|uniref:cytochrome P450 750A1-like n=1 Tax=Cryptomeria japonica TaxID=3369 RepID=UPI0027DA20AC|nr:cytochrome P450 750A1-like [Cryptomeria japonica]